MRKNIIHIGLILLLAPCYTACSSFLDELPDNRTELDTEQSIANILVSAYPQSTNCEIGELYSDNTDENSRAYGYWQKVEEDLYNWKDTYEEDKILHKPYGMPAMRQSPHPTMHCKESRTWEIRHR